MNASPIKTLAASGVGGFRKSLNYVGKVAPLGNVDQEDVGRCAAFLLSDPRGAYHRRGHPCGWGLQHHGCAGSGDARRPGDREGIGSIAGGARSEAHAYPCSLHGLGQTKLTKGACPNWQAPFLAETRRSIPALMVSAGPELEHSANLPDDFACCHLSLGRQTNGPAEYTAGPYINKKIPPRLKPERYLRGDDGI